MKLVSFLAPLIASTKTDYSGHKVFRVTDPTFSLDKLHELESYLNVKEVDVWSAKQGNIDFMVGKSLSKQVENWLTENGIAGSVFIENLQDVIDNERNVEIKADSVDTKNVKILSDVKDFNYTKYHDYRRS